MPVESPLPPVFALFLDFWKSIRAGTSTPLLADLLDRPRADIHPWLNIVDVEAAEIQPIRFAGTGVVDYFGKDLTHTNFLDILSPQARPIILHAHHEITAVPCGAWHAATSITSTGREFNLFAMGLPFNRANGLPCVAWRLAPELVLGYTEPPLQVKAVTNWRWIDLGNGVP